MFAINISCHREPYATPKNRLVKLDYLKNETENYVIYNQLLTFWFPRTQEKRSWEEKNNLKPL